MLATADLVFFENDWDRQLRTLRDLACIRARSTEEACERAIEILRENPWDVPFALLYLVDPQTGRAHLAAHTALDAEHAMPETIALASEVRPIWPIVDALRGGQPIVLTEINMRVGDLHAGPRSEPVHCAMLLPFGTGVLVCGMDPERCPNERTSSFFTLVGAHVAQAIASARSTEDEESADARFFASHARKLRTPLRAIVAWTQMLKDRPCSARRLRRGLEAIERNARNELRLLRDLALASRELQGEIELRVEAASVSEIVREAIEMHRQAARAKGITIAFDLDPDATFFDGDATRLRQAIACLVSNAVKFTPASGRVMVRARRKESRIVIEVEDTGRGIDPSFLPYVWQRGCGLALVQKIVEAHHGDLRAESAGENLGATFVIEIPASDSEPISGVRARPATLASRAVRA